MKTIGIIGCGNMGGALLRGFRTKLEKSAWDLLGCNRSPEKLKPFEGSGIAVTTDIALAAGQCDILVFAVKPYQMNDVLARAGNIKKDAVVVSIAAGFSLAAMRAALGPKGIICRCMPTTTATVGQGIFAFCFEDRAAGAIHDEILKLFGKLGYCLELPENSFTNFSALVGAGPAYVFSMMQGLVQAGVTLGFSHAQSRKMIAALFSGCAEMAAVNDGHLLNLRDEVCSPGGLTIAGVNVLDKAGMTGLIVEAVLAAAKKGRQMES